MEIIFAAKIATAAILGLLVAIWSAVDTMDVGDDFTHENGRIKLEGDEQ